MNDDERAAWLLIVAPALVFVVLLLVDVVLPRRDSNSSRESLC